MRTFFFSAFCALISIYSHADTSLVSPYDQVELLPFNGHSWYPNGQQMANLFAKYKPEIVIEVGSWMGASTRHIASLLPAGGKVYAVDHWKGSEEHQPGKNAWNPILPKLYEQFLSNVIHAQLTDVIIPVRMSSVEASQYLANIRPDVVYIDASHDFESVYSDLTNWYPFVKGHGILCGDDWQMDGVSQAVKKFAKENHLRVITPGARFWYLHSSSVVPKS